MKTTLMSLLAIVVAAFTFSNYAQSYGYNDYDDYNSSGRYSNSNVTVEAESSDISYNLDLRAVANVFADSEDLEEFERRINDYNTGINNLDLNNDGQVDYLRVIETAKGNTHLVVIQAVVGYDMYQDVASIVVERKNNRRHSVPIIGDPYVYGPYYIIEPVYVYTPSIFSFFWGPRYHRWFSPYYWGYYPSYWSYWNPYPLGVYVNNINIFCNNYNHSYNYSDRITSNNYNELRRGVSRSDYQRANPDRSFVNRNSSRSNVTNRKDLGNYRGSDRDAVSSRNNSSVRNDNSARTRGSSVDGRTNANTRNSVGTSRTTRNNVQMNSSRGTGAVRDNYNNSQRTSGTNRVDQGTRNSTRSDVRTNTERNNSRSTTVTPRSNSSRSSSAYSQPSRNSNSEMNTNRSRSST